MTVSSFAPVASAFLAAGAVSANVTIPTGGTIAAVTNTGEMVVYGTIGTAGTLAATFGAGMAFLPGETTYLTIGTATTLAAVAAYQAVGLSITVGN